jgi:hypothetical protein
VGRILYIAKRQLPRLASTCRHKVIWQGHIIWFDVRFRPSLIYSLRMSLLSGENTVVICGPRLPSHRLGQAYRCRPFGPARAGLSAQPRSAQCEPFHYTEAIHATVCAGFQEARCSKLQISTQYTTAHVCHLFAYNLVDTSPLRASLKTRYAVTEKRTVVRRARV